MKGIENSKENKAADLESESGLIYLHVNNIIVIRLPLPVYKV